MQNIIDFIASLDASMKNVIYALIFCDVAFIGYYIYRRMLRSQSGEKMLEWIDGRVQDTSGRFDWNKKRAKLKAMGVEFYNPTILKPHMYILMCVGTALTGVFLLSLITVYICPFGIIGAVIPDWYFGKRDKSDNKKMIQDVMTISSALSIQVTGGEYVGIALAECKDIVYTPRLKKALEEFDIHMRCNDLTITENIENFSEKFTSEEILALCTVLKQGLETGRMIECSRDLSKQCLSNRDSAFSAKKGHLDRASTIAMLILFADGVGFIFWRFIVNLASQL